MRRKFSIILFVLGLFFIVFPSNKTYATRLWSSGFEVGSSTAEGFFYPNSGPVMLTVSSTKRSGSYSLQTPSLVAGSSTAALFNFTGSPNDGPFYFRFYLNISTRPSATTTIWTVNNSSPYNIRASIKLKADGALALSTEGGTILGSSAILATSTWYRIGFLFDRTPPAGSQILKAQINGVEFASSTARTFNSGIANFGVGANISSENQSGGLWYFDDLAVNDGAGSYETSYPGEGRIVHLKPNAAGDNTQGTSTPSGQTAFSVVDESTPDDDSSYWTLVADNDILDVNLDAVASTSVSSTNAINVVSVGTRIKNAAAGTSQFILRIKSQASGTIATGTTQNWSLTSWYPITTLLSSYTDPQSGGSWTPALLENVQVGIIAPTAAPDIQVTSLWALVEYTTNPLSPSSLGPTTSTNGSWSTSTQPTFTFIQSDSDPTDTVKYNIQISTSSSFASQTVDYTSALLSQTSTSFTVGQSAGSGTYTIGTSSQTLSDGQYYWRAMSTDNLGSTSTYATANSGSVAFGVDTTAPAGTIASSTYGTITSSSIIINRPSTSTITESGSGLYQWQVRRNSTTTLSAVSTSTTSTSDTGLTSNTQYTYDVRFYDLLSNISSYGATSSKYTLTSDPANFSATPSQTSNALSVDSFNNASSSSSGYYFLNTTNNNNSTWITANSWQDTGLTCNTSYSYTIQYRNGDGTTSATSSLSQTTSACAVSAAVANAGLPISILASAKPQLVSTNIPISISINQYQPISFSRYLYPGLSNPEVKNLQTLLSRYPDIYPEAKITGYFGPLTKQAVQKLQIKYDITDSSDTAFGYVGPKTRRIINLLEQINYLQSQLNQILIQLKKFSQ